MSSKNPEVSIFATPVASTLSLTEVPESNMWAACRLKLQPSQRVVVGDSSAK